MAACEDGAFCLVVVCAISGGNGGLGNDRHFDNHAKKNKTAFESFRARAKIEKASRPAKNLEPFKQNLSIKAYSKKLADDG